MISRRRVSPFVHTHPHGGKRSSGGEEGGREEGRGGLNHPAPPSDAVLTRRLRDLTDTSLPLSAFAVSPPFLAARDFSQITGNKFHFLQETSRGGGGGIIDFVKQLIKQLPPNSPPTPRGQRVAGGPESGNESLSKVKLNVEAKQLK